MGSVTRRRAEVRRTGAVLEALGAVAVELEVFTPRSGAALRQALASGSAGALYEPLA